MECYDITVSGINKEGYSFFTRNVQLLAEMPDRLVKALKFAARYGDQRERDAYIELADLLKTLFEAGE